jgi:CRP-like cAMP-binding protein
MSQHVRGEAVITEGEQGDALYIVEQGQLEVGDTLRLV